MSGTWKVTGVWSHAALKGMASTAFPRDMKSTGVPAMTADRLFCVAFHVALPAIAYILASGGHYEAALAKMGYATYAIAGNRKLLLHALDVFYGVRWAVQDVVQMSGKGGFGGALKVSLIHLVLHVSMTWIIVLATPGLPADITPREMLGAGIMVAGGLLQSVSETQRYLFKRKPANAGKLHTGGLFSIARFINTTGHVMRDVGVAVFTGVPKVLAVFFVPDGLLMTSICATETVAYMRAKYRAAYTAYERKTPALFIPGVW